MSQNPDDLLQQINSDLKDLTLRVESAFSKDEDGNVDYSGHRQFHREQKVQAKALKETRAAIIKNIVTWVLIGALTVVGSALAQAFLASIPKT